jgi:hypothetical protein
MVKNNYSSTKCKRSRPPSKIRLSKRRVCATGVGVEGHPHKPALSFLAVFCAGGKNRRRSTIRLCGGHTIRDLLHHKMWLSITHIAHLRAAFGCAFCFRLRPSKYHKVLFNESFDEIACVFPFSRLGLTNPTPEIIARPSMHKRPLQLCDKVQPRRSTMRLNVGIELVWLLRSNVRYEYLYHTVLVCIRGLYVMM